MITLTRAQREALKKVFDRGVIGIDIDPDSPQLDKAYSVDYPAPIRPACLTYRQFRRKVMQPFHDDCIMVPWSGMLLGIEPDGYTHS